MVKTKSNSKDNQDFVCFNCPIQFDDKLGDFKTVDVDLIVCIPLHNHTTHSVRCSHTY